MSGINLPTDAGFHAGLMETVFSRVSPHSNRPASADQMAGLEKAAKDFESVFIHKLLDSMRESIPDSGLLDEAGSGQMDDLFWHYLGEEVGRQGGLGVWKQLSQQLQQAAAPAQSAAVNPETEQNP